MGRNTRDLPAGAIVHVVAHAIDQRDPFPKPGLRLHFLQLLEQACARNYCKLYAYALMTNHIHILVQCDIDNGIEFMMCRLLAAHSRAVNQQENTAGPRWVRRYSSKVINDDSHFLNCCLYIDANPWRAGLVDDPLESDWTSGLAHVSGIGNRLLTKLEHAVPGLTTPGADSKGMYQKWMDEYTRTTERFKTIGAIHPGTDPLCGIFGLQAR